MNGSGLIAAVVGFALWTSGVAYFADQHGYGRAEEKCQAERDAAAEAQDKREKAHAGEADKLVRDLDDERDRARTLQERLDRLRHTHPVACRIGPQRLQIWNAANQGADVSGGAPEGVPGDVSASSER